MNNPKSKMFAWTVFFFVLKLTFSGSPVNILVSSLMILQQESWTDGRRWQLTVATELPELEEKQFSNRTERGGGGFRGGRGRNFGGFRNGGGGGYGNNRGGGGHKRSFSQAFDYWSGKPVDW